MRSRLHVGTSGYQYDHWRGVLYPEDLPRVDRFEPYAEDFDCVEISNTFYQLPEVEVFEHWRERAPRGFIDALKFSRYCTHLKKLTDAREPLAHFCERAERLGPHLGPILVQSPPGWHADPSRLARFLAAAPRDFRWAVEFRDPDWLRHEVYDVLREAGAALVIHDLLAHHPVHVTAGFVYLRRHGRDDARDLRRFVRRD